MTNLQMPCSYAVQKEKHTHSIDTVQLKGTAVCSQQHAVRQDGRQMTAAASYLRHTSVHSTAQRSTAQHSTVRQSNAPNGAAQPSICCNAAQHKLLDLCEMGRRLAGSFLYRWHATHTLPSQHALFFVKHQQQLDVGCQKSHQSIP